MRNKNSEQKSRLSTEQEGSHTRMIVSKYSDVIDDDGDLP